jgi:hypothetical protein
MSTPFYSSMRCLIGIRTLGGGLGNRKSANILAKRSDRLWFKKIIYLQRWEMVIKKPPLYSGGPGHIA